MKDTSLIILAAGRGKRMGADSPKALTMLNGISLIENLLKTISKTKYLEDVNVVIGFKGEEIISKLGNSYNYVWQREQLGTGHAVRQCENILKDKYKNHFILYGDMPFVSGDTIHKVLDIHSSENSPITIVTLKLDDFNGRNENYFHFGRIVRDDEGEILKIVEFKDATDDEKNITELNPAIYCIKDSWLWENLDKIRNNNNQGEYYLTDLVSLAHEENLKINSFVVRDSFEMMGINTPEELEIAKSIYEEFYKD